MNQMINIFSYKEPIFLKILFIYLTDRDHTKAERQAGVGEAGGGGGGRLPTKQRA